MKIKQFCKVCGTRFEITKENMYLAREPSGLSNYADPAKIYEAIDCPTCGCQRLLGIRLPKVEGKEHDSEETPSN